MLEALGLEPGVELVYRALLAHPSAAASALADEAGLVTAEVETALATLSELGLARCSAEQTYVAAPPAVALGALITDRRDGLRLAEQALVGLAEVHRASLAGQSIDALIEVVTGVDAIRHRYQQVQQSATTELRMFVTAPFVAVPPGENAAEPAAVDRGVRIRAVLERAVLEEPGATAEAIDSLRNGLDIRVADALPIKLVLADDDLALVPLTLDRAGEPGAVLLQRSGLVAALESLFEAVWHRAYPLELSSLGALTTRDEGGGGPTAMDRRILTLLLAGLTDQAVAAQLDLSLRTVQRRLRHLQDLAGVQSRMQLGWYAARHDWV
ncbi:MAG TPA: transcriptional regulator TrmB [Nocardioides bacterium]|nr:transcriptional regulator TrmB [Nocardioides sp.]